MSYDHSETLAKTLPEEPFSALIRWLLQAGELQIRNPNAMTLATVDAHGAPAARVVLCKDINPRDGYLVFYTNYLSQKGTQLLATPRASAAFYWDALGRQVRVSGPVVRSPASESDAYFSTRDRGSRLGAWASQQSQPIESREALLAQLEAVNQRFADDAQVPRPPHWGGIRLWASEVELWAEGRHRIHDRARWQREVSLEQGGGAVAGPWQATRLQP